MTIPSGRSGGRLLAIVAMAVVAADQLSKSWAVSALPGDTRHVIWKLQWNLSFNRGMAFSQAQGFGPIIGALALVVVVVMALSLRNVTAWPARLAGGLVVGGAIGNLIDRLFRGEGWLRGAVVDFVDFQFFPIFNIADAAITVGGVLFALWTLRASRAVGGPVAAEAAPEVETE